LDCRGGPWCYTAVKVPTNGQLGVMKKKKKCPWNPREKGTGAMKLVRKKKGKAWFERKIYGGKRV